MLHLALLIVLAVYLVLSLNSVRRYAPIASTEEIQIESLNTLPALLGSMDIARRAYQKDNDPRDLALYSQNRRAIEKNLADLNTPLLLPGAEELQRRALVNRWLAEVGEPTFAQPGLPSLELDRLNTLSTTLLENLDTVSQKVRTDVQATLADLQTQEANDASHSVNLMWIGVGTVTVITIVIQLLISNSIIAPIQALANAVRRLQAGDYTTRTLIRSGDEIQSLGETLNSMASNILLNQQELEEKNTRLSSQQEALRNVNASLEERVAEKTHELEDKNQKLSQAARLKDEFLATLSHELRTPLTPVISCAHLLTTDPTLDPGQLKNVAVIDRNARALSRMIDELLDLSAVMNNKLRLARERTEMNEWTRATIETMHPVWEKKKLEVVFHPADKPVELDIDPTRLAQVITNLISNAIKYTPPEGKITVELSVQPNEIRIAVTDTGTGLNQHDIYQIFEMFHQSRTPHTQSVGGLGVGLTVARSLAELHGGGLLAESPGLGHGATFTLWLPRQPNLTTSQTLDLASPASASTTAPVDRTLLRGKRILLVEDSDDTREALQRIFQRRECKVATAASGEEALDLVQHEAPDIILSDIGLPGMTGLEFMTKLRSNEKFRDIIAIALSGLGREQDIKGASDAGFNAHLLKPIDITVLDQLLLSALEKKAHSPASPS